MFQAFGGVLLCGCDLISYQKIGRYRNQGTRGNIPPKSNTTSALSLRIESPSMQPSMEIIDQTMILLGLLVGQILAILHSGCCIWCLFLNGVASSLKFKSWMMKKQNFGPGKVGPKHRM